MKKRNIHYIGIAGVAILLLTIMGIQSYRTATVSFYGIAQTNALYLNYNYPVRVTEVHVTPGEFVAKGTPLLSLEIIPTKHQLFTNQYEVDELKVRQSLMQQQRTHELNTTKIQKKLEIQTVNQKIQNLQAELTTKKKIASQLQTVSVSDSTFLPLETQIQQLKSQKSLLQERFASLEAALFDLQTSGSKPLEYQIDKLNAEINFENSEENKLVVLTAPKDGVVNDIYYRPNMSVPTFETLVELLEPTPSTIKGFVHESDLVTLQTGDQIDITSAYDSERTYQGKVVGLGSRIVEIPERLRKNPKINSFGREVHIRIDVPDNTLVQEEKVFLSHVPSTDTDNSETLAIK